jgi:hypothetical protein
MFWVRQARERKVTLTPEALKGFWGVRANCKNLDMTGLKLWVILTQLRQMPAAIWSGEPAKEDKQNMRPPTIVTQLHKATGDVRQGEVRRWHTDLELWHGTPLQCSRREDTPLDS